jgi:hypothetical protein
MRLKKRGIKKVMFNGGLDDITIKPEDEHICRIINKYIACCQKTMFPEINKAQNCADVANNRIDYFENEMTNKDTGKVTIIWKERKEIIRIIMGTGATLIAGMIFSSLFTFYSNQAVIKSFKSILNSKIIIPNTVEDKKDSEQ